MRFKILFLTLVTLCLCGCVGEGFSAVGDAIYEFFGGTTDDGADSPATSMFGFVGPYLPGGLGILLLFTAKVARSAIKAKKALYESTTEAINDGSLASATTSETVKDALNDAQKKHDDSKLLAKSFDNHKNGGVLGKIVNNTLSKVLGKFV